MSRVTINKTIAVAILGLMTAGVMSFSAETNENASSQVVSSRMLMDDVVEWCREKADSGNAEAQFLLGRFYDCGFRVDRDRDKAVNCYQAAATQGHVRAQHRLDNLNEDKLSDSKENLSDRTNKASWETNPARYFFVLWWFCFLDSRRRKIKQLKEDNAIPTNAKVNVPLGDTISMIFSSGIAALIWWFVLSFVLSIVFHCRDVEMEKKMETEREEIQNVWKDGIRKQAEQGDARAQQMLGFLEEDPAKSAELHRKALETFRKAAAQGDATAQHELGFCYATGIGVEKDDARAAEWFRKAAEQGNVHAQLDLGDCYANGKGVEKDAVKAVEWYRKAAEQGDADAQVRLGECYMNGEGVPQNDNMAMNCFLKAVDAWEIKEAKRMQKRMDERKKDPNFVRLQKRLKKRQP